MALSLQFPNLLEDALHVGLGHQLEVPALGVEGRPVLAQQPTNIPDVSPRPSWMRHRRGMNPNYEARMLSRYLYRKSEEGKLTYDRFKGEGILV